MTELAGILENDELGGGKSRYRWIRRLYCRRMEAEKERYGGKVRTKL